MANRRLLISYAHPDDESFGLGGLISKYVAEGVDVYLICATNGDAGSMDEEHLADGKTIKEVRLAELQAANEILGFKKMFLLGYHDSGMMGSETNQLPDALWNVWQNNPDEVTARVVDILREVQPQVIITFNEYGGYGHPDHIAIQQATVAAMELVNDPTYTTANNLPPYQPQKLYYSGIPRFPVQVGIWLTRLQGKNPRALGRNHDIDIVEILNHISVPTTEVDIRHYLEAWDAASACHASQGGGKSGFIPMPLWMRRRITPTQNFTLVYPAPAKPGIIERDLFENVTADELKAVSSA